MNRIARILLAAVVTSALLAGPLAATERGQRYIVILKQRAGAAPDVVSLGGVIESRQDEQLVVVIPTGSLAALKGDPRVRYIEPVRGQPSAAEDVLIGEPSDPQPGLPSQPKRLVPHTLGSTPWDSGTYAYDGAGDIITIGTDNYLYDGAQRLKQSSTRGTIETYTYDGFGNMKTRTNTTIPPVDTTTNRYVGNTYNEIGAVAADGSYTFSYDPVGQPLSKTYPGKDPEYYLYTASDERIGVQRGGWWTWSVRDQSGKVLRQYKSSVTNPSAPALWLEDFVWRDGLLLGSQRPPELGGRRHYHLDHLGTPRLITADNGQRISAHDYYPFGDEQTSVTQEGPSAGGFDREDPMKFTGHERDYAGGMGGEDGHAVDYMHARYYSPILGRFLLVDPVLEVEKAEKEPQRWNRYAYVMNNPMDQTDPTGKVVEIDANANVRRLKVFLMETMRRPTGRADVMAVINDPNHKLRMTSGTLTSPAQIHMNMQNHGSTNITFGQTVPNGNVQLQANGTGQFVVTGSTMTIDTNAVSQHHTDQSGVTTTAHEFDHVNDLRAGGVAQMKSGDVPSSATGPAEQHGQTVAAERPDLTAAQARQLVDQLIPVRP